MNQDPHRDQPVLKAGPTPEHARLTAICIHGRGASAHDILDLAHEFAADDVAYLAPQAADNTWYPYSFLQPIATNEPGLTSGLRKIESLIRTLEGESATRDRIVLLGFSQGACLALEFAARHATRYAAVIGLSGGVIGPPGTPRDYKGTMNGTPVFLACSDIDPHIPIGRVHETAEVFRVLGAVVDERIYPGMGHLVNTDEIAAVSALLASPRGR